MEVQLAPETESQLNRLARETGRSAEQVVLDAVERLLREDTEFIAAVQEGFDSLDRSEFLTHDEVGARMRRLFQSQ